MSAVRRYVPFLVALVGIALISRVSFVYGLIAVFVVLGIGVRRIPARLARGLVVSREMPDRAFPGDRIEVEVTVANPSRIPVLWVDLNQAVPTHLRPVDGVRRVVGVGTRTAKSTRYELDCLRRGIYVLEAPRATTGDPFGLTVASATTIGTDVLIVYPRLLPLSSLRIPALAPLAALRTTVPLFSDPARVSGVRDYQRGDSTRSIHWTATAASGRLMVKQLDPTVARETIVALDIDRRDYSRQLRHNGPEMAITVAASVAAHIVERERLPVGLVTEAIDGLRGTEGETRLSAGRGQDHLMDILEVLARAVPPNDGDFADLMARRAHGLAWGTSLLVVTGSVSEQLAAVLSGVRGSGSEVFVMLVSNSDDEASTLRLDMARVPWASVTTGADLEGAA